VDADVDADGDTNAHSNANLHPGDVSMHRSDMIRGGAMTMMRILIAFLLFSTASPASAWV